MASRGIRQVDRLLVKAIFGLILGGLLRKTMMIQSFKCDFQGCGKDFTAREKDGQPNTVGGIRGVMEFPDGVIKGIELDFCPECWKKLTDFLSLTNKSKIVTPNEK